MVCLSACQRCPSTTADCQPPSAAPVHMQCCCSQALRCPVLASGPAKPMRKPAPKPAPKPKPKPMLKPKPKPTKKKLPSACGGDSFVVQVWLVSESASGIGR
jgi:hypothetical protein